jgi:hypothetical protein
MPTASSSSSGDDLFASEAPAARAVAWFWGYVLLATAAIVLLAELVASVVEAAWPPGPTKWTVIAVLAVPAGVACEPVLNALARASRR